MSAGETPVFDRVQQLFEHLPRSERKIAHALLADYPIAGLETLAKLAARAGTSQPTVLRLVNRLGFARYSAFQQALRNELQIQLQSPLARYDGHPRAAASKDVFRRVGESLVENLRAAVAQLPSRQCAAVAALLADEQRPVHFLGRRFTHALAIYFFHYLRELRARARLVEPDSAAWPIYLLDIGTADIVVLFDFRRYQPDVVAFGRQAARQGATVVLFTDAWRSPAAAFAPRRRLPGRGAHGVRQRRRRPRHGRALRRQCRRAPGAHGQGPHRRPRDAAPPVRGRRRRGRGAADRADRPAGQ